MSTRTYVLNFTGAGMLPLPQGRFFMIKSAVAALTITARNRNAQPVEFINVGAGLQFNALENQKWTTLEVVSAAAQVVEIVISDEASVTFANTVTVSGAVNVLETPATTTSNTAPVAAANAAETQIIAANPAAKRRSFTVDGAALAPLFLRDRAAGQNLLPLQPGISYEVKNTSAFFVRNDSGGATTVYVMEEL